MLNIPTHFGFYTQILYYQCRRFSILGFFKNQKRTGIYIHQTYEECVIGDQIQAVNGQNILSMQYSDALNLLSRTVGVVELVLSQVNQGQEVVPPPHSRDYVPGETAGR